MRRQLLPDELDNLFRSVGRDIWHIQYLEDALHTLLALKVEIRTPGRVTLEEAQKLLAKHRRSTLGTALRTAEEHNALSDETLRGLRKLKEDRDWLVHRSMHQDGESLYTSQGRDAVFARLEQIMNDTLALKKSVIAETAAFCAAHGVSEQAVNQIARQKISRLKGEA